MAQERKVPVLRSDNSLIEQEFESIREKFDIEMHKMEQEMSKFRSQLIASENNRPVSSLSSSTSTSTSTSSSSRSTSGTKQQASLADQQQSITFGNTPQQILGEQRSTSSRSAKASIVKSSIQSAYEEQQVMMQRHKQKESIQAPSINNQPRPPSANSQRSDDWLSELSSPLIKDSDDGNGKILKLRFDVTQYEPDQIVVKTVDNRLQVHAKREQISQNTSMYREYNREFLLPEGVNPETIRSSLSADGVLTVEAPLPIENGGRGQRS